MTDYKVALSFEDGETRFITVADDQSIADAAYRQRINIPVDCNDGACGTCKAYCESGSFDPGFYVEDALSESEAEQGFSLPARRSRCRRWWCRSTAPPRSRRPRPRPSPARSPRCTAIPRR